MQNPVQALTAAMLAMLAGEAGANEDKARAAIRKLVPDAEVESIQKAPMPGWYSAVVNGTDVYVSADGAHLMSGSLWQVEGQKNLTEAARAERRRETLADLPDERKIHFDAEREKHAVTVFTAIDCGYCRQLHEQVAAYNEQGISIEYVLFPRAGADSPSYDDAVSVWCAADRREALTLAKRGEPIEPRMCPNPIGENRKLAQKLGLTSTPTIVAPDGTVMLGYVPPLELRRRLDGAP
ncbi:MAG: DsbC family protein [Xanthomonadales bacterium]|nr:Thiol:disulfide interchange protein DsbC [Xanthomonadales bacterium]MCC6592296.1 DsbC family protein [Xanthomonadales bacterium]